MTFSDAAASGRPFRLRSDRRNDGEPGVWWIMIDGWPHDLDTLTAAEATGEITLVLAEWEIDS